MLSLKLITGRDMWIWQKHDKCQRGSQCGKSEYYNSTWITTYEDDLIMKQLSEANLVMINCLLDCHILKLDPENIKGMKDITTRDFSIMNLCEYFCMHTHNIFISL